LLDVVGQNYRENEILAAHNQKPTRKILGTENTHDRNQWVAMRDHAPYAGQFLWTGIDYLGESRRWPVVGHASGLLDRTARIRPIGLERGSWWEEQPMVAMARRVANDDVMPTDPGYAQEERHTQVLFSDWSPRNTAAHDEQVEVYSNCKEVELFLNGQSLGKKIGGHTLPSALLGPFSGESPTSGIVFSRQSLERIMPISEREWRICADYYLCAASSLFGATERIEQPLGKYRIHGQNNFQVGEPLARVRNLINLNLKLHGSLSPLMTGGEIGSLEQWLGNSPEHWFRRIISLREGPRDHPWPDSIVGLTTRAVRAAWRRPGWRFRQRLACSIQAISYGLIPGKAQSLLSKY